MNNQQLNEVWRLLETALGNVAKYGKATVARQSLWAGAFRELDYVDARDAIMQVHAGATELPANWDLVPAAISAMCRELKHERTKGQAAGWGDCARCGNTGLVTRYGKWPDQASPAWWAWKCSCRWSHKYDKCESLRAFEDQAEPAEF